MERQIFVAVQGQRQGPYTESQVRQLLAAGTIASEDLGWSQGLPNWAPLAQILPPDLDAVQTTGIPDIPEYQPRPMPAGYAAIQSQRVGGWLLVYCVLATIIAPLYAFATMYNSWQRSAEVFAQYPSIRTGVLIENFAIGVVAIAGICIGIALWVRVAKAKRIVQGYLIARLVVFILVEAAVVAFIVSQIPDIGANLAGAAVGACVREGIYFGVWFTYFARSVRVRNTYGV